MPDQERIDPRELVELLEEFLLGEAPTLTGPQVAERAGISFESARERWRALGFSSLGEDETAFTEADIHAMKLTQELVARGLVDSDSESALIRTMGRAYSRLAEWQMGLLASALDLEEMSTEEMSKMVVEVTPVVEELQNYVWRRHTLAAASRLLLAPETGAGEEHELAVGFADIVGYTRQSRSLSQTDLARLVEAFEAEAQTIVTEYGGRILKSIGDEVLFVADTAEDLGRIAVDLVEQHEKDKDFPELRVGAAFGPVLARLGDVFGPVVNVAARLTSTARPGTIVVDRDLAESLADHEEFRLKKLRRTSVKGYRRLEPWSLRRRGSADSSAAPAADDATDDATEDEATEDEVPGSASGLVGDHA